MHKGVEPEKCVERSGYDATIEDLEEAVYKNKALIGRIHEAVALSDTDGPAIEKSEEGTVTVEERLRQLAETVEKTNDFAAAIAESAEHHFGQLKAWRG